MSQANLLVAGGAKPGNDQIAMLIEQEEPVAVRDQKRVGPAFFARACGRLKGLPQPISRVGLEPAQLPIAADAVDIVAFEKRSADDAVQTVGELGLLALGFPLPN